MIEEYFRVISYWLEPIFLIYFGSINLVYTILLLLGTIKVYRREKELRVDELIHNLTSNSLPGISFLVPAYNEEEHIVQSIENLLGITYPAKEIIIINDGSTDQTLELISKRLNLKKVPYFFNNKLPSAAIRGVYRSLEHPEFWVIDKENGRKHDALNAALNICFTPYFITFDADTRIDNAGFEALIRPIFTSPETIAMGASVRILNGCDVEYRSISSKDFPKSYLAGMQSIEYLRAFLMRQGWDYVGGNYILSGAFTIFVKKAVVDSGGFQQTEANDLEVILRLNRIMLETDTPYHILYLPDPVAWTDTPQKFRELGDQRLTWHRGLMESLWFHKVMILNPRYKIYGLFVIPFVFYSEVLEPIMEVLGILYVLAGIYLGVINYISVLILVFLMWGFTFVFTVFCLFIEDQSFRRFSTPRTFALLFFYSLVENLGYRQLNLIWRIEGTISFIKRFPQIQAVSRHVNRLIEIITNKGKMKWKRY